MIKVRNFSKFLKKVVSCGLIAALVTTSPIGVKSSEVVSAGTTKYIKEVVLSYGKTENDARNWLKNNGYEIVNGDLNKGTDTSNKDTNVVLMGYKTTTDVNDAVRDISLMEMTGGFSITDMDTILNAQAKAIDDSLNQLLQITNEYKVKYKAAVKAKAKGKTDNLIAIEVHDLLNKYKEDDSKKGMGDILLKDFSNEDNKEYLRNILVQANPSIIAQIENVMVNAAGNKNENWVDKLSRLNKDKTYYERIKTQQLTNKRAKNYIEEKYDNEIKNIEKIWTDMQEKFKDTDDTAADLKEEIGDEELSVENLNEHFDVTDEELPKLNAKDDDFTEKVTEFYDSLDNMQERNDFVQGISVAEYLAGIKYGDKTMYDFFTKERDFEDGNDLYEVCAIFEALSDAQTSVIGEEMDLYNLIKSSMLNESKVYEDKKSKKLLGAVEQSIEDVNEVSVYDGVNRKIYEGKVAITSATNTRTANDKLVYNSVAGITLCTLTMTAGMALTAVGTLFFKFGYEHLANVGGRLSGIILNGGGGANFLERVSTNIATKYVATYGTRGIFKDGQQITKLSEIATDVFSNKSVNYTIGTGSRAGSEQAATVLNESRASALKAMKNIGIVLAVAGIVISAFSIWGIVESSKKRYIGDYSVDIPEFMVDILNDDDGEESYVYYEAVKCNRNDKDMNGVKKDDEGLKDFGDINGDSGRYWVAMYTSKDSVCGKPIVADSLEIIYGDSEYDSDYAQVHNFNSRSTGANFTSEIYNFNDEEGGTYVRYKTANVSSDKDGAKAGNEGSIIASKNGALMLIIGLIGGFLVGGFGTYFVSRRKKEEE
ncbi:MAG: hypothetical protein K6D02_07340 [Lachnospiraceae bacterium]|nr:hypothetical protein [Lachnospiraceae bacterium]